MAVSSTASSGGFPRPRGDRPYASMPEDRNIKVPPPKRIEGRTTFEFSFPIPVRQPRNPLGSGKPASKQRRSTETTKGEYERQRSQDPERQNYHRNYQSKRRDVRIAAGLCTRCPNTAIPGETYCETCRDLHRTKRAEYERDRNQNPERKEVARLEAQKDRRERKAAGLCKTCHNKAIPGQIRCEVCRDKHRVSRRVSAAKRREEAKKTASTAPTGAQ